MKEKRNECMIIGKGNSGNESYVRVFTEGGEIGIGVDHSTATFNSDATDKLIQALKYAKTHK